MDCVCVGLGACKNRVGEEKREGGCDVCWVLVGWGKGKGWIIPDELGLAGKVDEEVGRGGRGHPGAAGWRAADCK